MKPIALIDQDGCRDCGAAVVGRSWRCEDCKKKRLARNSKRHYEQNKEQIKARVKQRHAENPDRRRSYTATYERRRRPARVARDYGITIEEATALLAVSECAICHRDDRPLTIDHDHATGRVRGRLCQNCNRGIGLLGDDASVLRNAIGYLEAA